MEFRHICNMYSYFAATIELIVTFLYTCCRFLQECSAYTTRLDIFSPLVYSVFSAYGVNTYTCLIEALLAKTWNCTIFLGTVAQLNRFVNETM